MKEVTQNSSTALATAIEAGSVLIITLRTTCLADTPTTNAIEREIRSLVEPSRKPSILIDCSEVRHMSVSFLGLLKDQKAEVESRGGTLHCCGMREEAILVLNALGLGGLYAGTDLEHALDGCLAGMQQN